MVTEAKRAKYLHFYNFHLDHGCYECYYADKKALGKSGCCTLLGGNQEMLWAKIEKRRCVDSKTIGGEFKLMRKRDE